MPRGLSALLLFTTAIIICHLAAAQSKRCEQQNPCYHSWGGKAQQCPSACPKRNQNYGACCVHGKCGSKHDCDNPSMIPLIMLIVGCSACCIGCCIYFKYVRKYQQNEAESIQAASQEAPVEEEKVGLLADDADDQDAESGTAAST